MTRSTVAAPSRPRRILADPPKHLEKPERELWAGVVAAHRFDDTASLALLRTALEAHQRSRRCREAVDKEGEAVTDRFGQRKAHPLLNAERDARAAFLAAMRALNLDLGAPQ